MERTCSRCGEIKDESLFQKSFGGKYKNYCYACKGRYEIAKNRLDMYANLGAICACCGESHPQFLTLDHVQNDGAERRKEANHKSWAQAIGIARKEGWPRSKWQVLCYNCNCAKGHWGACPHQSGQTIEQYIDKLRSVVAVKGKRYRNFQERLADPEFKESRPHKSQEMMGNKFASDKLTKEDAEAIRQLGKNGMLHREIAKRFGVGRQMVSLIINRKRWA